MSSIFERPELNKIFLVYGNLDDMFISPDLQKNNFRPFLNSYLRSLGYEQIVFYSGAKNTGKLFWMTVVQFLLLTKTKVRPELLLLTIPPLRATVRQRKNIAY